VKTKYSFEITSVYEYTLLQRVNDLQFLVTVRGTEFPMISKEINRNLYERGEYKESFERTYKF